MLTCSRELLQYLGDLVDKRSKQPTDDLISKLVVEQVKPGHLAKDDAVQVAFLLLVAGNATMVNMIALVCWKTSPLIQHSHHPLVWLALSFLANQLTRKSFKRAW